MATVTILMATYNGQQYIREQLSSIINQTFQNWNLVIRDDGSSDDTLQVINEYTANDKRIKLIRTTSEAKGACGNFSALYSWAKQNEIGDYMMFSDQDDIWLPDKIEFTINAIKDLEKENEGRVCLIYGQVEFIDESGNSLEGRIKMVEKTEFRYLISYNYMYGCTMMMNRALVDKLDNIPVIAENHDYWIALFGTMGAIHFINRPLLKYRKHESNVSGNVKNNSGFKQRIIRHTSKSERLVHDFQKRLNMLVSFYYKYRNQIGAENEEMLRKYLFSFNQSRLSVIWNMLKYRILRYSLLQTISSFYLILFFYNQIKSQITIPDELRNA
jgi:rhamnosyltransferase